MTIIIKGPLAWLTCAVVTVSFGINVLAGLLMVIDDVRGWFQ